MLRYGDGGDGYFCGEGSGYEGNLTSQSCYTCYGDGGGKVDVW
jgi:hypothetical protein